MISSNYLCRLLIVENHAFSGENSGLQDIFTRSKKNVSHPDQDSQQTQSPSYQYESLGIDVLWHQYAFCDTSQPHIGVSSD